MTIELAKVLAIAGVIASSLVTVIIYLNKWVRSLVKQRNEQDAKQIADLQERLDATSSELTKEREARLKDQRDFANGVIALSHRFREAVMAVTKWTRR